MSARIEQPRWRPLLFSGPMVLALLREIDPKTVTRRLIRGVIRKYVEGWKRELDCIKDVDGLPSALELAPENWECCPYGVAGDKIWVRERMRVIETRGDFIAASHMRIRVRYEADGTESDWLHYPARLAKPVVGKCLAYGGHREASRIALEVKSNRAERLQDITEEDAKAEGVVPDGTELVERGGRVLEANTARAAFVRLWNEINYDRSPWADNAWVWRIEFRRLSP